MQDNSITNTTVPKSALQLTLEGQFKDLLEEISKRFASSGEQMAGMSKWMQVQLQLLTNKLRNLEIGQNVMDVNSTAILELLFEKRIITEEEYKEKTQKIIENKIPKK